MSNFEKKLEDASEEDLKYWINERTHEVVHFASDELTRRSLQRLQDSVKKNTEQVAKFARTTTQFNIDTSRQTKKMISLTRWIVVLTVVIVIGLIVQIYLATR